jgi:sugar phosphate isomerase/epimerase
MASISRREMLKKTMVVAGTALVCNRVQGVNLLAAASWKTSLVEPDLKFPATPRERLAVASWPFRAYIESKTNDGRDKTQPGMDLREFSAQVKKTFDVPGVEPLSSHFSATDDHYVHEFRKTIDRAGVQVVDIPVDNKHSYYDADGAVRKKAVENGKKWVDIARILGSPSVRTSITPAANAKPDADVVSRELSSLLDYAAAKNIIINLENDNLVSEDAFFLVKVIEKVNNPYLQALPDFCNSMMSGNEKFNYEAVGAMFRHAYNICHVKDSEANDGGKIFRVDLRKTFEILKASKFQGYCSMEWEGGGNPYEGTRKLIAASLENLA